MLVKSARRYINTLDKILKNQHNDIITEIIEDDDMDIFSVTLKFHIDGLYCFVAAFNNDDNVLYYVEGNGRAVTYIISDNETQKESMYTILNRIYDIVVRLSTEEPEEPEEPGEPEEPEELKDVMEVKQELNARFGKEQYFDTDSVQPNKTIIENINHCPNQNTCCIVSPFVHCNYNYKSDSCIKAHKNFIHVCEGEHKQMKAINNPNWHTVRLATVNSSDFFRLTEKLKLYISAYRELKQTLSYLRKCKTIDTYDRCYVRYIRKQNDMLAKGKFTDAMLHYIRAKLSMQNVESGVWASGYEEATGRHKSRRYNKSRI